MFYDTELYHINKHLGLCSQELSLSCSDHTPPPPLSGFSVSIRELGDSQQTEMKEVEGANDVTALFQGQETAVISSSLPRSKGINSRCIIQITRTGMLNELEIRIQRTFFLNQIIALTLLNKRAPWFFLLQGFMLRSPVTFQLFQLLLSSGRAPESESLSL